MLLLNIQPDSALDFTNIQGQRVLPVISAKNIPYNILATSWYQQTPIIAARILDTNDGVCEWAPHPSSVEDTKIRWENLLMSFAHRCFIEQDMTNGAEKFVAFQDLYKSISSMQDRTLADADLGALVYLVSETQLSPQPTYPARDFKNVISYVGHTYHPTPTQRVLCDTVALELKQLEIDLKALSTQIFAMDGTFEAEFKRWKYKTGEFSVDLVAVFDKYPLPELSESTDPLISIVDWINQTGHDKTKPITNDSISQFIHPRGYHFFGFGAYNELLELNAQLATIGQSVQLWDGDTFQGGNLYLKVESLLNGFLERHKSVLAS